MVEAVTNNVLPVGAAPQRSSDNSSSNPSSAPTPSSDSGQPKPSPVKNSSFDNSELDKIAGRLVTPDSRLAISHDNVIERFIYKFVDKSNGSVLRQYPAPMVVDSLHTIVSSIQRFLDKRA